MIDLTLVMYGGVNALEQLEPREPQQQRPAVCTHYAVLDRHHRLSHFDYTHSSNISVIPSHS